MYFPAIVLACIVIHRPLPHAHCRQTEAKELAPPGSYVWRAHGSGSWCGRMPPNRERTRSWSKWGERRACIIILQGLWQEWADLHGQGIDSCPIVGLFESDDRDILAHVVERGPASSSSAQGAGAAVVGAAAPQQVARRPATGKGRGGRGRAAAKSGAGA